MRFTAAALSSLSFIATLSSTVAAHASHNSHQHDRLHHRQAPDQGSVVITSGAKGLGDGKVHSRLEVTDMFRNRPDQWNLLLLAMQKFQSPDSSNVTGYYAICGIHGVPRQEWNGVAQCDSCQAADGYCTHDSVLFPGWHRAYMALYEQEFLLVAKDVVDSFPAGDAKDRMQNALQSLRWPYFDWAAKPDGDSCLPEFLSSPKITVTAPNGRQEISNPLYGFQIPDPAAMYYRPFNVYQSTLRYPTSNAANAASVDQGAVSGFDDVRQTLQDQLYTLLANCDDYLYFSNDSPGGTYEKCTNSLEAIHNSVHTTGGGPGSNGISGGHLTYLPNSAFDPIFWFHHCQVDRILALWQTIYPNSYGASQKAPHATWTIAQGSTQDVDSDLKPFRDSPTSFWTTRKVQNWESAFGYTYPEFASTDGSRQAIIDAVNSLYGPNADKTASSISRTVEKGSISNGNTKRDAQLGLESQLLGSLNGLGSAALNEGSTALNEGSAAMNDVSQALTSTVDSSIPDAVHLSTTQDDSQPQPQPQPQQQQQPQQQSQPQPQPTVKAQVYSPNTTSTAYGSLSTGYPTIYPNTTVGKNTTFTNNNGSTYEYLCHFQSPRYSLNGSYLIYAFDGTPKSDDTSTWNRDSSCIGSIGIMAGGDMANPAIITYGGVPMTRHLQERCKQGQLKGMQEKHVVPYLQQNLEWKIVRQGEVIHPHAVPNFQAAVYSGASTPPGANGLRSWSNYTPQVAVTKEKAGGAQSAPVSNRPVPAPAQPAAAPSGTVPAGYGSPPAGTGSPSGTLSNQPPAFTGGAGKPSFQIAGLLAAAGLVAFV